MTTLTRRNFLRVGAGAAGLAAFSGCARLAKAEVMADRVGRNPFLDPSSSNPYRLPWTVVPRRYQLQLEPHLDRSTFDGEETVDVDVRVPVSEILLNAAELRIQTVAIQRDGGERLTGMATLEEATERVHLLFPVTLAPGPWRLFLRFSGQLNHRLRGFYRSTIQTPPANGSAAVGATGTSRKDGVLAVTQFQPTDARRAFPCWDEPAFKAVFQIAVIVDEQLEAVSNTAVVRQRGLPGTGKKVMAFAPTIKMSSYLVALVVGELEATDPLLVNGTPVRIWCTPGKTHLTRFALEIATFSLRFFEQYYGMPYPGDKLDLIAVPDFAFGAMENLGAIICRESTLLVDEKTAAHAERQRVADTVAHEIAHMWFGDLVTMTWWNGLWLNEAFATFMAMLAVNAWKPSWKRWVSFGASRAGALRIDGLGSTRPIEFDVLTPQDAESMFDVLTYDKGAAVLRMLEQYLGPGVFRKGIQKYLIDHQFGNADTTDLWRALEQVANVPIPAIMDGWIFRAGYPLLTVRAEAGNRVLVFSQHRFTYLPQGKPSPQLWKVPINFRVRVNGAVQPMRLLLSSAEERVALREPLESVVVNEGGSGFYRTRYAGELLTPLVTNPSQELTPIERVNLVDDAWAAALVGRFPIRAYLDLTKEFRPETDRNVWTIIIASFACLNQVIEAEQRPALAALVRDRLRLAVARLGWSTKPADSQSTCRLRGELLRAMGTLGNDAATQVRARELYIQHRQDPSVADPNVLSALIAVLAHSGGAGAYSEFLGKFKTARTPQEQERYLYALASFRDPNQLQHTLRLIIDGEVRSQDAPRLTAALLLNVDAREQAWGFVKANWERMAARYSSRWVKWLGEGITGLATSELETDVRRFFAPRDVRLGGRLLEQYLERLRVVVSFRQRTAPALEAYLAQFSDAGQDDKEGDQPVPVKAELASPTRRTSGLFSVPALLWHW